MKEKEVISIAYAMNDKHAELALISMISVLENTKSNIEFLIAYSNLSNENIKLFKSLKKYQNCKISMLKIDESEFDFLPISKWVTLETWYRIKFANIKTNLDKLIYLDCDTLAKEDIKQLWDIDVSNYLITGVNDVYGCEYAANKLEMKTFDYFNAGVLLINCKKWREENIFNKIKEFSKQNYDKLTAADQDAINKITDGNKLPIHQKFNYLEVWWQNNHHEYKDDELKTYNEAKLKPVIIHFTAYKPTLLKNKHSFKDLWWEYAKKSDIYLELLESYKNNADSFFDTNYQIERRAVKKCLLEIDQSIKILFEKLDL